MLIKNAWIVDPASGIDEPLDILIKYGVITAVGKNLEAFGPVIDAKGLVCCPGLCDMHVHLRQPGFTHKETIETGCKAAAAGGFTAVACMPNTLPVVDTPELVAFITAEATRVGHCKVYPVAAATKGLLGAELTNFIALKAAGAVGISDDGRPVESAAKMQEVIKKATECGLLAISHCEDLKIIDGGIINKGKISEELGVKGMDRASEDTITERECALAEACGGRVHIAHVSTRGSVDIIRKAKARGVKVTAETAPHYFMLTDELLKRRDANFRMNPPLREQEDVEAVLAGVLDGTIDCIITDHAPHTQEEKKNFETAPNGVIGLETSLAAVLTVLYHQKKLPLARIVELMSQNPTKLLGISGGSLSVGSVADITLFDPNESWIVHSESFKSKARNTAFEGMTLKGRVKYTVLDGKIVYKDED
ncbi:MAG: dihydroorotase [Hydrogenoanaerobacterium sp.]